MQLRQGGRPRHADTMRASKPSQITHTHVRTGAACEGSRSRTSAHAGRGTSLRTATAGRIAAGHVIARNSPPCPLAGASGIGSERSDAPQQATASPSQQSPQAWRASTLPHIPARLTGAHPSAASKSRNSSGRIALTQKLMPHGCHLVKHTPASMEIAEISHDRACFAPGRCAA